MTEKFDYEYMTIDLEACFDPIFEPPIDFWEECKKRQEAYLAEQEAIWEEKQKPTLENTSFYVTEPDGTTYFYCGNTRIKVSEHFADEGKPIDTLIEDVIQYAAGYGKPELKPAC